MKPLLLSTYDIEGGAARATYRLHQGLKHIGISSQLLTQTRSSDDPAVIAARTKVGKGFAKLRPILDTLLLNRYPQRDRSVYSVQWFPDHLPALVNRLNPDIINLHWICNGFLQIETLAKFKQPLVWTLHDMWAFTGGCHYDQECDRYTAACGACPQLHSHQDRDLSRWIWQRKAKAWKNLSLTIVTPSKWLATCAERSSLFQKTTIRVIPHGLDTTRYKPIRREVARELLNLPQDKQLILFGALDATTDSRKGFHLLQPALQQLGQSAEWRDQVELVVFGASQPQQPLNLAFKPHYLGQLKDDISLALVYAAADVFVAPSVQDNLPNTVLEALACGTPCVAFKIGGMADMISHQQNGYLAQPFDVKDFAQGIAWVLEDRDRRHSISAQARQKAEQEFNLTLQAQRYLSLFQELLEKS